MSVHVTFIRLHYVGVLSHEEAKPSGSSGQIPSYLAVIVEDAPFPYISIQEEAERGSATL